MQERSRAQVSGKLEEADQKFVAVVRKYLAGERLTPTEERIIAYGYTAATCGQRIRSSPDPESYFRSNRILLWVDEA